MGKRTSALVVLSLLSFSAISADAIAQNVLLPQSTPSATSSSTTAASPATGSTGAPNSDTSSPASTPVPIQLSTMLGQQQQSQTQIGVNSYISADEQNGYIAKEQQNIASLQQAAAMLQQQMTPAALKGMSQQDVQALIPINNQAAASINIQLIKSQQRLLALQSGPLTLVNLSKLYAN